MKRTFHLLGQAVPLVLLWAAIVEIGFRMQQYFGPLYDLDMASINLNWESDVVNRQPTPEQSGHGVWPALRTGMDSGRSLAARYLRASTKTVGRVARRAIYGWCRLPTRGGGASGSWWPWPRLCQELRTQELAGLLWPTWRRFDPSSSPSATHIRRPDFSIDGWAENPQ
jgi:hypothetical protein